MAREILVASAIILVLMSFPATSQDSYPDCGKGEVKIDAEKEKTADYPVVFTGCYSSEGEVEEIFTIVEQTDTSAGIEKTSSSGVIFNGETLESCEDKENGCEIVNQNLDLNSGDGQTNFRFEITDGKKPEDAGIVDIRAVMAPNVTIPVGGRTTMEKVAEKCNFEGSDCLNSDKWWKSYAQAEVSVGVDSLEWGKEMKIRPGQTIDLDRGDTGCSGEISVSGSGNSVKLSDSSDSITLTQGINHDPENGYLGVSHHWTFPESGVKVRAKEEGENQAKVILECEKNPGNIGDQLELESSQVNLDEKQSIKVKNVEGSEISDGWRVQVRKGGEPVETFTGDSEKEMEFDPKKSGGYEVVLWKEAGLGESYTDLSSPNVVEKLDFDVLNNELILKKCPVGDGAEAVRECIREECGGAEKISPVLDNGVTKCVKIVDSACSYALGSEKVDYSKRAVCKHFADTEGNEKGPDDGDNGGDNGGDEGEDEEETSTSVEFTVENMDEEKVSGATLEIEGIGQAEEQEAGVYQFGDIEPGTYDIDVECEGSSSTRNLNVKEGEKNQRTIQIWRTIKECDDS